MSSATSEPHRPARGARFEVIGRVQGVGFRWWAKHAAESLKITGTVRNRADGAVEIEAWGTTEALDSFDAKLRNGPPAAQVKEVRRSPAENVSQAGFEIVR